MTQEHKDLRASWAREAINSGEIDWTRVVFSDEERFNVVGPDGRAYYWSDSRMEERYFSRHQGKGVGIMVWGAFCDRGTVSLCTIDGRMDSKTYTEVLETALFPAIKHIYKVEWPFQQDIASVHVPKYTTDYLSSKKATLLKWPAKSPDLNPIENLWGDLFIEVYKNFRQFNNVLELTEAVKEAWDKILKERCRTLIKSMPKRCLECSDRNGNKKHY